MLFDLDTTLSFLRANWQSGYGNGVGHLEQNEEN